VVLLLVLTIAPAARLGQQPAMTAGDATNPGETFAQIKAGRLAVKAARAVDHADLLSSRYVLDGRLDPAVTMSGGKPIPIGPTAKLAGVTWEQLGEMTPDDIRDRDLFPYKPLPFADHAEGGMLFPATALALLPRLTRFDLDFDLPDYVLPEAAPALYLTTRPDLGDVTRGRLVTIATYSDIFNGILNPKQLDGLRLLLTQFPQQQFNATEDRARTPTRRHLLRLSRQWPHQRGAHRSVISVRRRSAPDRVPSLRGVNVQRCSDRSGRSRRSRISRNSGSGVPTSTATMRWPRRRAPTCWIADRKSRRWRSFSSSSTSLPRQS
jgi:hypothetical protein